MLADKSFCLDSNTDLKQSHQYYVQVQMFVCNVDAAQFIVWTPTVLIINSLSRDHPFLSCAWPKLIAFFKDHIAPELLTHRIELNVARQEAAAAPVSLYCICQKPYDKAVNMIGCDNPDCRYQWFHFICLKIKRAPNGKWICKYCRNARPNKKQKK
jgi:chromatin modification-related protein YNG2/inhibitor-of-growth protein 1